MRLPSFEKKYSLLSLLLAGTMLTLGWLGNTYYQTTVYSEPILPDLDITFSVNTSTGRFESWYTHQPLLFSKQAIEKDLIIRRKNLERLVMENAYDSDPSPITETLLEETDSYKSYTVSIPTERGYPPAHAELYIPKNIKTPAPAILFTHGHFEDNSLFKQAPDKGGAANFHAIEHAKAGFITLSIENRGTGYFRGQQGFNQIEYINYELLNERSFVAIAIKDAEKALAYLRSRIEVDTQRIGVAGVSLGGELAGFIGARNPDIRAVVISGFLTTYQGMLVRTSVHDLFWPGILRRVGEYPQIVSVIAPRPLLIQQGNQDAEFYTEGYRRHNADNAYSYVRNIYDILGVPFAINRYIFEGGHVYQNANSIEFFKRHL